MTGRCSLFVEFPVKRVWRTNFTILHTCNELICTCTGVNTPAAHRIAQEQYKPKIKENERLPHTTYTWLLGRIDVEGEIGKVIHNSIIVVISKPIVSGLYST